MLKTDEEIVFASSYENPNLKYFIFRPTGEQVTIKLVNGNWHSDRKLSHQEKIHLNNYITKLD